MKTETKKILVVISLVLMVVAGVVCSVLSLNFGNQYKSHIEEYKTSVLIDKLAMADGASAKTEAIEASQNQLKIKFASTFIASMVAYVLALLSAYIYYTNIIKLKE